MDDFLEKLREEFADDDDAGNGDEEADRLMSLLKGTLGGVVECIVELRRRTRTLLAKKRVFLREVKLSQLTIQMVSFLDHL